MMKGLEKKIMRQLCITNRRLRNLGIEESRNGKILEFRD